MTPKELKKLLEQKYTLYNTKDFIENDPIAIPHQFTNKRDIEIIGFLVATIAWGNRKSILNSGNKLIHILQNSPYDFIINHQPKDLKACQGFVHRTFNELDLLYFIYALNKIYTRYDCLEDLFLKYTKYYDIQTSIHYFKKEFLSFNSPKRTHKHISDPLKNSAAKRINMMLRWFVRKDKNGVDFGIWSRHSPALLSCPLDVHTARVSKKLGLLKRKQLDAKAVAELDQNLQKLDTKDPVKYDFALFGMGVYESF